MKPAGFETFSLIEKHSVKQQKNSLKYSCWSIALLEKLHHWLYCILNITTNNVVTQHTTIMYTAKEDSLQGGAEVLTIPKTQQEQFQ